MYVVVGTHLSVNVIYGSISMLRFFWNKKWSARISTFHLFDRMFFFRKMILSTDE